MTWLNGLIIAVYMVGVIVPGILCRGRQDNTRDYFTAQGGFRGRVGTIMVGLSIGATLFSGLSLIAFPSMFFTFGVTVLASLLCFPISYLIVRFWFLPRYLAEPQESPYDVIERRCGRPARLVASVMFVLVRLCWMAALIYVPVLVIMAALGLDAGWFWPLILLVGVSSSIYTVAGGIRGVIITDAIQFAMIMAVLLATILYIVFKLPLSAGETAAYLRNNSTLLRFNWSLDPTATMTVLAMAVGGTLQNMSSYVADQMSLQRYLASGGIKPALNAFATSMITTALIIGLLCAVGLAIGSWYHVHPDLQIPADSDKVFPYFIATQLPDGFMGLLIAGILAATMSSITSGINALSGSLINDFVPLRQRMDSKRLLTYARVTSALIGVFAMLGAGFVDRLGPLFNIMYMFFGVLFGPLLGCMICTLSRLPVHGRILAIAMILGSLAGIAVIYSPIANLWMSAIACTATISLAWGGTFLLNFSRGRSVPARSRS